MKYENLNILGIRIDAVTFKQTVEEAVRILNGNSQHYFTTPNPEIVLNGNKNSEHRKALNGSDLNIPDGIGLLFAAKFLKLLKKTETTLPERVTGTDLTIKLIKLSKEQEYNIFFLGASENSNEKTVKFAKKHGAYIAGNYTGSPFDPKCIELINKSNPDLVLVAFGHPNQELWIAKNLKEMPSVKLAIGIGGAFDFIAGSRKRAPALFRKLGLEWLYRLIQEPKRVGRIFNAAVIFPLRVLINTLTKQ